MGLKVAKEMLKVDKNATKKYTTDMSIRLETILFNRKESQTWMK